MLDCDENIILKRNTIYQDSKLQPPFNFKTPPALMQA